MKKKTLAIIISLAMMATAFCGVTATASATEETPEYAYFNIFLTDSDSPSGASDVVTYKTYDQDQYAALAKKNADPIGAVYFKNGVNVIKSSKYVVMSDLLAKFKLNGKNVSQIYATDIYKDALEVYTKNQKNGKPYIDYLNNGGYFYGATVPSSEPTLVDPGTAMPLALSVENAKVTVADTSKYATISEILTDSSVEETAGITMLCPSSDLKDDAGFRICQGMNGVALDVDEQALVNSTKAAVKVAKKKTTVVASNAYASILKAESYPVTYKYYAQKKGTSKWIAFNKVFKKGQKNKYYRYKVVASIAKEGIAAKKITTKYYKFRK